MIYSHDTQDGTFIDEYTNDYSIDTMDIFLQKRNTTITLNTKQDL